ncbi:hypothetical protein XELAEV_18003497mg [Xenopus laevis]|nr:hypothetical protein XELAEV_18003497mg [Xenopus laevis]
MVGPDFRKTAIWRPVFTLRSTCAAPAVLLLLQGLPAGTRKSEEQPASAKVLLAVYFIFLRRVGEGSEQ